MALPQDGQNANGLTKVTEIPKGKELIFIDPATNEGGIITLEDLTTQILNKLTSKIFTLDQGNMPLLAALYQLNSKALMHNKVYSTNYDTINLETIEIDLGGAAGNAVEILLMDKYRMIFVHAYSADGKTITEISTKTIYGDNVTPATNNTIISIHVGAWASGTVIMSYNKELPPFSIK